MQWKADFCIGIESIDAQHKAIFEHLLAIENSVHKQDAPHIQSFFFQQLGDYLQYHFAVEEALLEVIKYPQRAEHAAAHLRIKGSIEDLRRQVARSKSSTHLVSFFEDWFIGHVLDKDREYVAYARQHFPGQFDKTEGPQGRAAPSPPPEGVKEPRGGPSVP